jgi:hypothetical protein
MAWRELFVRGAWGYAANRFVRTLPVEPHPSLPSLSQEPSETPISRLFFLDACFQCMTRAEKTVYLNDILSELVFQTGAPIMGEGDRETGNLCAAYRTREDAEIALKLARRLIETSRLNLKIEIVPGGCPVG